MTKLAVILSRGFEEGEAITIADILRRANLDCDLIGLNELVVCGGHGIKVKADGLLNDDILNYDWLILPGGYEGVDHLLESEKLISYIQTFASKNKHLAAICAAPIVFFQAGVLKNKNYTAYVGYDQKINDGNYLFEPVVKDGHLLTSCGPCTVYQFTYAIIDEILGDSAMIKERMLYPALKKGE